MATVNVPRDFEISWDTSDTLTATAPTPPRPELQPTPGWDARVAAVTRQAIPLVAKPAPVDDASVCAEGAARSKADELKARELGFSPAPPVFEIGTKVNAIGVGNFRQSRTDWEAKPRLPDLARNFADLIRAERRADSVVKVPECYVHPRGNFKAPDGQFYTMSQRAMDGLATHVTPGGAAYLKQCPPDLRAANLNHWIANAFQRDARESKRLGQEVTRAREITLRTRARKGGMREVYAVTGPKYVPFNVDAVASEAAKGIGGDARGDLKYDGYRMTLDAVFHSNIAPEKAVAGEFFKGCVRITAADDGSGAINVKLGLWRNLCRNLIIVDFDQVLVGSRRHIGKAQNMASDVAELMATASERINLLVGKWNECSTENVLERYDLQDVDEVFNGLVINGCVSAPGVTREDMVKRLHAAWEREPGYSKTDILNAITRAAHENTWSSWSDSEELESQAGELLYQRVWNLDHGMTAEQLLA